MHAYVVTPGGKLRKFDVATTKIDLLNGSMPQDSNYRYDEAFENLMLDKEKGFLDELLK